MSILNTVETFDAHAPGMDKIQQWLIDCLRSVPSIAAAGREGGFTEAQIMKHLYRDGGRPDMPIVYRKIWQATLQLAGGDEGAFEWLDRQPPELQEWFAVVLRAGSDGSATLRDGTHRTWHA